MNEGSMIGIPAPRALQSRSIPGVHLGKNHRIERGSTIFANVFIGKDFSCGEMVLIRDQVAIGDNVTLGKRVCIGPNVCIESKATIGSDVTIPAGTVIHEGVFIGQNTRFLNPPGNFLNPQTVRPIQLKDYCVIGANCCITGGITIGEYSRIAAGTRVSQNVPSKVYALGNPLEFQSLND